MEMMFRRNGLVWILLLAMSMPAGAQVYFTKNGRVAFSSKTILENISAENNQVISILNIQTGEIRFSLLNRAFNFPKAKMEEDFNEDYIESNRFPRSEFTGSIVDVKTIDFKKDGNWDIMVSGNLQIHGVTKRISVPGHISIKDGNITASASFTILVKDFNIKIPSIVSNKIAESVGVTVDCLYQIK